jgi:hypothetical protein
MVYTEDSKPTTNYSSDSKPSTSFSNDSKPTTNYLNDSKVTTSFLQDSKPKSLDNKTWQNWLYSWAVSISTWGNPIIIGGYTNDSKP